MNYYRSCMASGGGSSKYDVTYTASVNGELQKTSATTDLRNNSSFNDRVVIGNNVINCASMLENCSSFNQDIIIPEITNSIANMLLNCTKFSKNIYIRGKEYRDIDTSYLFDGGNNSLRKNVFFNSILNNRFNRTSAWSIAGESVTWAAMTNGFYNTTYNIYCYYNYSG